MTDSSFSFFMILSTSLRSTPVPSATLPAFTTVHLKGMKSKSSISYDEFANRFKAIDLRYQHMLYKQLPESKEQSYLQRLQDPETVRSINDRYFSNVPLDLERL